MPAQIVTSHTHEVVIGKDKPTRYGIPLILGCGMLLVGLVSVMGPIMEPHSNVNSLQAHRMTLIVGVLSLLMSLYQLGPCELRLDPHTRRYRFTCGLPLLARTLHGPYDDIKAIVIRSYVYRGQATLSNRLDVEWKTPGRKTTTLRYLTVQKSYEIRDEIQNNAGFPVQWET